MLFHVTHTHEPAQCLYRDPERLAATFGAVPAAMEAAGARMVGSWVNGAAHAFYYVVDVDSHEQLLAGLDPIVDRGHADIRPLTDLMATVRSLQDRRG